MDGQKLAMVSLFMAHSRSRQPKKLVETLDMHFEKRCDSAVKLDEFNFEKRFNNL